MKKRSLLVFLITTLLIILPFVFTGCMPTKAKYTVEYYLQNIENNEFTLDTTHTYISKGIVDGAAVENPKTIEGFTFTNNNSILQGMVREDGSLTLKLYYTRNTFTLSTNDTSAGSISKSGTIKYGESITCTANPKVGYVIGWYSGETLLSTENTYTFTATQDVTAKFEVKPELSNFTFTANENSLTITGLKNENVTEIVIPDSVTSIGYNAFYGCDSLTSVTIGDSVISIGIDAFAYCSNLTRVNYTGTIDSWVEIEFGNSTANPLLYAKNLYINGELVEEVELTTATKISSYAFENCTSLTSITIGNSVTSIGSSAFYYCTSLTSITIGNSVTSIGYQAFYKCSSLTSIEIPDSVTSIGNYAFYNCTSLTSITIPDSVTSIGSFAFAYCSSLTSITIPDSVTSIRERAFYNCSSLTSITIPDSVTSIGSSVFRGCSSLESITLPFIGTTKDGTSNTHFGYIFGASSYSYNDDYVPTSLKIVVITSGESIGEYAFEDCTSLTSITIPDSVTTIGNNAFYNCPIENATIPTLAISYIPKTNLKTVVITSGESIGISAFEDCDSLTSVTIPDSVTSIGSYAFYDCSKLTKLNYIGTIDSWVQISFSDSRSNPLYYAKNLYINNELVTNANITTATKINDYVFYNCDSLTSATIPDSVTSIGSYAFYDCSKLTKVNYTGTIDSWVQISFSDSRSNPLYYAKNLYINNELVTNANITTATKINDYVFYNCDSLTSATIPDSVTSIGNYAFSNCTGLTSVTIPNSVTRIGNYAFSNTGYYNNTLNWENKVLYIGKYLIEVKSTIEECEIKEGTLAIADSAFYYCKSLTNVEIPDSVISIGNYAFYYCKSLTNVTIPDSVTRIGACAFESCSSLTSVTIPNSVTSIGACAFEYCSSLTSVEIPDSITSIGSFAFKYCTSLTTIEIPDSVTSIGDEAFCVCDSLTTIEIPNSVTSIGADAFYYCTSLKNINFNGTKAQWNAIRKGSYWKYNVKATYVTCTDGTVNI